MSRWPTIDRLRILRRELAIRGHDLSAQRVLCLDGVSNEFYSELLQNITALIRSAKSQRKPVIAFLGGHPIKLGLQRFLIDLVERGFLTHIATNGSGLIHDFELAAFGGTSENVAKWIQAGQFGLWEETGRLNDIIREGAERNEGLGEAIGRTIEEERLPHWDLSIAAAGYRCGVPATCHITIGADIIHSHPNCDGAALGKTSYTDFLIFARAIQGLEGGVFLNIGSAVTGPEVFLKALSMARNIAHQEGKQIRRFTTAVFDLVDLPENWRDGPPSKDEALYYYRPWKTLLCRTVADGGQSYYIRGDHRETIPALWQALVKPADSPPLDPPLTVNP